MSRKVFGAGLSGAGVLIVWTFVVNGVLGFQAGIDMKSIPAERQVYETLKEHVVDPGRYIFNPEVTPEGRFPGEEPVFSVLHGGMGHGSAGGLMLVGLALFLLAPMIGAWMLSQASDRVISSYPRKLLFFVAMGMLLAIAGDLADFGIGGYPFRDAMMLAGNDLIVWILVGMVVAWRIKPGPTDPARG